MSVASFLGACADQPQPTAPDTAASLAAIHAPAPPGLRQVSFAGQSQMIWPYTTAHFPAREQDPMNMVFVGRADPRNIRNALLALDGNRPHFPPASLFACTWKDAIGGHQATYSEADSWTGSVIQLECGDYQPLRFHLRLFPAGEWTLVNAHLDIIIPDTHGHEVIAWELARKLVVYDFQRSGLLDPTAPLGATGEILPSVFGRIHPEVFAGLPNELKGLLLLDGSITPDGQLLTSTRATIVNLAGVAPAGPRTTSQEVLIQFGRIIPKPFCNAGNEFVRVEGPLRLQQRVEQSAAGVLTSQVHGAGDLLVTPIDPQTGLPSGPTSRADVGTHFQSLVNDRQSFVSMRQDQHIKPTGMPNQREILNMRIGPHGQVHYSRDERCGS